MPQGDTKQRILGAAERLFAERGFGGTSLRAVTAAAGVNLAAVHYHFGSKEALLAAVLAWRVAPLNAERLARLDRLEAAGEAPSVEAVLEALIEPALQTAAELRAQGGGLRQILGRIYSEPAEVVGPMMAEHFGEVVRRFSRAFGRALPEVPRQEVAWRLQFAVGAMIHLLAGHHELEIAPEVQARDGDVKNLTRRIVHFLSAGFRAPSAEGQAVARRSGGAAARRGAS